MPHCHKGEGYTGGELPCGHGVLLERYQALEREIRDFLDSDETTVDYDALNKHLRKISVEWAKLKEREE